MSSRTSTQHSSLWLFGRSFMPTAASLMTGFLLAMAVVIIHVLTMTLNQQAPQLLNEHARQAYNTSVVDPLLRLVNNTSLNNGLGIVLWGVFGYMLYAIIAFIVSDFGEWRAARLQVRIAAGGIVQNPMQHSLFERAAWRLFVGALFVAFTLAVVPLIRHALFADYSLLLASSVRESISLFAKSVGIWMLVLHGYTVLLRWYMMRTRVMGEIIY